MPAETTAAICDVIFGGVLERFPRLKLCFAHGAGAFPYTVGRIQRGFDVSNATRQGLRIDINLAIKVVNSWDAVSPEMGRCKMF